MFLPCLLYCIWVVCCNCNSKWFFFFFFVEGTSVVLFLLFHSFCYVFYFLVVFVDFCLVVPQIQDHGHYGTSWYIPENPVRKYSNDIPKIRHDRGRAVQLIEISMRCLCVLCKSWWHKSSVETSTSFASKLFTAMLKIQLLWAPSYNQQFSLHLYVHAKWDPECTAIRFVSHLWGIIPLSASSDEI